MRNGKVGMLIPAFLVQPLKRKLGGAPNSGVKDCAGKMEPDARLQDASCKEFSKNVCRVVGWMLLGLITAGPNLPNLHSQDSHAGRAAGKKREITSVKPSPPPIKAQSSRQAQKPLEEIVLPDIYIAVPQDYSPAPPKISAPAMHGAPAKSPAPADTVVTLKRHLEKAERELEELQRERSRILKTLEKNQKPSAKDATSSTALTGRPSV